MTIEFDMYGNLIPRIVKYRPKQSNLTKDEIKELKKEKRTFFCSKHNCFHKYLNGSKISKRYQECLTSQNVYKFKENMSNTELFKNSFKRNWSQDKANYYKD